MSIRDLIKAHEDEGTLKCLRPPRGQAATRGILLAPEAQKAIYDANSAIRILGCAPATIAALERWVTGALMLVRFGGRKSDGFLAKLDPPPDEVWEFRVTQPRPQVRALGRFAMRDTIVVTHIHTRNSLGSARSPAFEKALSDCVEEWKRLFPVAPPHSGETVSDYISNNFRVL